MARHVAEGGNAYDDFGKHISGMSEELSKLRKFKQYMNRSSVMAESLTGYVEVVKERMQHIQKTIAGLQKESFYKQQVESFEPAAAKDVPNEVAENWIDQLTIKQFNEELKDVFPYIYNLVSESTKAKNISYEDIMSEETVGGDAIHTVVQGDTVSALSSMFNIPVDDIIEVNGLDDKGSIRAGERLLLPGIDQAQYDKAMSSNIGAGGTREIGPNGEPTGSTRGIDPADNYSAQDFRRLTTGEAVEYAINKLLGQFNESDKGDMDDDGKDEPDDQEWRDARHAAIAKAMGADDEETKESKTPLGEFILSYFDKETGQFPKGPTAVLTMVEKEYGEQYVRPAGKFIERIDAKVAEVMGYREAEEEVQDSPELDRISALAGLR
jgi:LysM repeat protein